MQKHINDLPYLSIDQERRSEISFECIVKFTVDEAQYAIDNMNADFNHNALEKAKSYQESMSMSPEAIRDQLTSQYGEKFTQAEADYAIANLDK